MIKTHKLLLVLSIWFITLGVFAQGVKLLPLKHAHQLNGQNVRVTNPIATILVDTLDLPFFDDFSYDLIYPDSRLWQDNDVFINNTFSINQPSRGMATFDHLDSNGAPYNFLTRFTSSFADTLTSQCINLKNRMVGMILQDYLPEDSIYLSFFLETGGLGDAPENGDSLILQFKKTNGTWSNVWFVSGNKFPKFRQQFISVKENDYLHNAFQFRFINFVKNSGNMNHFHLDYVQINEGRNLKDTLIKDVSFTVNPQKLLSNDTVMPYSHFLVNPGNNLRAQRNVYFRNNNRQNAVFATLQSETRDHLGNQINFEPFASSQNINILANAGSSIFYNSFGINLSNTTDSMLLNSKYEISSVGNDATEINEYNSLFSNNIINQTQLFHQYYAYDDGSAEAGFALDYGSLPSGPGFAAMRFVNLKLDTLHGVDIHFNRALEDVGNRPINLIIWQQIGNAAGKSDQIIRSITTTPKYVNSKNGFARYEMDTLILLPPGEFFVGWRQNSAFNLNVGFDKNYLGPNNTASNSNIFYNLLDQWEALPSQGFAGTMMIRPLVGKEIQKTVEVKQFTEQPTVNIYPNPSNKNINVSLEEVAAIKIYDLKGKQIFKGDLATNFNINIEQKGVYICVIHFKNNLTLTRKIIIQ